MRTIKIALLRGINVGGHKKFSKADQLDMAKQLGFQDIQIYLHTGNWIFSSEKKRNDLEAEISAAILKKYDWEVPVIVKTVSEIRNMLELCPFPKETLEKSYFILLQSVPSPANVAMLKEVSYPNELVHYTQECIYFYPAIGAGRAKMSTNFFEKILKVTATARNFNTITKLIALAS